jgi:hypothetical protein
MCRNRAMRLMILNMDLPLFVQLVCLHDNIPGNFKLVPVPIEGPNARNIVTKQAIEVMRLVKK